MLILKNYLIFFENLKIPFSPVFAYSSENKSHELSNFSESIDSLKKEFNILLRYYIKKIENKELIYNNSINKLLKSIELRLKNFYGCSGGYSMFSITSDGEIYSCEHLVGKKGYSIGNINNINSSMHNNVIHAENVENIESCNYCWARYLCSGGCFSSNISSTGNIRIPETSRCDLIRAEWEYIISLYILIKQKYPDYIKQLLVNEYDKESVS